MVSTVSFVEVYCIEKWREINYVFQIATFIGFLYILEPNSFVVTLYYLLFS